MKSLSVLQLIILSHVCVLFLICLQHWPSKLVFPLGLTLLACSAAFLFTAWVRL